MGSAKRKRLAIGRERLHLRRRGSGKSVEATVGMVVMAQTSTYHDPFAQIKIQKTHDHPHQNFDTHSKKPIKIKLVFQFSIFECTNKREIDRRTVEEISPNRNNFSEKMSYIFEQKKKIKHLFIGFLLSISFFLFFLEFSQQPNKS